MSLPDQDVGPLTVPVQRTGPGHFTAADSTSRCRAGGSSKVKVLLTDIDEATATTTVPVK